VQIRDLKKEQKELYQPSSSHPVEIDVPVLKFLMLDGEGDPNRSQAYQDAVEALFATSYTLKFMVKKSELAIDYTVLPLEGLWWAEDMSTFSVEDKSNWKWTMMIRQPEFVSEEMVRNALADVQKKKKLAAIAQLRFEAYAEGRAAQIMHIGPFSAEGPIIAKLHQFIHESGHSLSGKHHEIYLSDIRKADPAKWKTVIRQPMQ
jgi:hypothetical protein